MTDVDAVNERLNGLVKLLHVVGIDGVNPDALVEEQKKLKGSSASTPTTQSSDSQILEIIKKLQLSEADSPEILAALKSPELRALASLAAQKQSKPAEPKKAAAPSLDDVMDDDDNYPKIGPGYSDDISVVSDLTTPTVMTKQHVAEEEYYRDVNGGPSALPPMQIGGTHPARPNGVGAYVPKKKNLVSQVKPGATRRAIAKTGGAAAQRRLNYQQAMAKLQSNEYGTPVAAKKDKNYMENFSAKKPGAKFFPTSPTDDTLPSELPSLEEQGKKPLKQTRNKAAVKEKKGKKTALSAQEEADYELDYDPVENRLKEQMQQAKESSGGPSQSSGGGAVGSSSKPKKKAQAATQDIDWGRNSSSSSSAWPAFGNVSASTSNSDDNLFVDDDGFFSSDAFANGKDPFATTSAKASKSSEGKSKGKKSKSKKDGEGGSSSKKEKSSKRKSRKATLPM